MQSHDRGNRRLICGCLRDGSALCDDHAPPEHQGAHLFSTFANVPYGLPQETVHLLSIGDENIHTANRRGR